MPLPSKSSRKCLYEALDVLRDRLVLVRRAHFRQYIGVCDHVEAERSGERSAINAEPADVFGGRLLDAEAEQNARHSAIDQDAKNKSTLVDIAAKESAGALEAQKKGQNIGLAISLACVLCAIVCALMDKPTIVTCAFLAVPTASLIGSFMPKLWRNDVKEEK